MEIEASGLSVREAELLVEIHHSKEALAACERRIAELEEYERRIAELEDKQEKLLTVTNRIDLMEGQWSQVRASLSRITMKPKNGAKWMTVTEACACLGYRRIDRLGERRRAGELPEWAWRKERCQKTGRLKQVYAYRSDWVAGEKEE